MERIPTNSPEAGIPQEAGPLADWIEEELGDEELAQFLRDHPEGLELCANGESLLPRTVFELVDDLNRVDPQSAKSLVFHASSSGMLPETGTTMFVSSIKGDERALVELRQEWLSAKTDMEFFDNEKEKTRKELLMIEYANGVIDEIRESYGLPSFRVEPNKVRYFETPEAVEGKKTVGSFNQVRQYARVEASDTPYQKFATTIHELLHFKSYGAIQVDRDAHGGIMDQTYRTGLNIYSRDRKHSYLNQLNEAITEETSNRLLAQIPEDHPVFGDIARQQRKIVKYYTEHQSEYLLTTGQQPYWFVPIRKDTPDGPQFRFVSSYADERVHMQQLFDKLIERNPERFEGKTKEEANEELFTMLQKAMFTGNILPFGRLFNDTFGRGKFREYGHLQSVEEQQAFIAAL
jgi:hypothetical protein